MGNTLPLSASELHVVHLDDNIFERERVKEALEKHPFDTKMIVESIDTRERYIKRLAAKPAPHIVILDINIDGDAEIGIELARETRLRTSEVVILMCSTMDDVATIGRCLHLGADDFLSKHSDKGELALRVLNSYRLAQLKRGNSSVVRSGTSGGALSPRPEYAGKTMERVAVRIPLIVNSAVSAVHIIGESGTGKEVVADLFAAALPAHTPFVRVNCGAIAPSLLQSELFGHAKGAFTGAVASQTGMLEAASGGWIFLDEVATLPPAAQVALLRALENKELIRVGESQRRSITIRVLSATNEPLPRLVQEGRFRHDLWQRLCEAEIYVAPLAERQDEIEELVRFFCRIMPGGPYEITGPALDVLCNTPWKAGNVRELRNCLRAMTELHINRLLTPLSIPERVWEQFGDKSERNAAISACDNAPAASRECVTRASELIVKLDGGPVSFEHLSDLLLMELIRKIVAHEGCHSLRSLAKTIGMSRSTLSVRLKGLVRRKAVELSELASLVGMTEI